MGNVTYVAGAALFAAFMPANGKSPAIVAIAAVGFAVVGAAYWLAVGASGAPGGSGSPGGRSPSPSAQRNSS
ncbi:MAG TPA: hypothetical protein VMG13_00275, partial [Trebonia sp.]|nr:hypothetical protein [Trebonia sp.]